MYAIVYWTNWTDSSGAYGGILDYRFMGVSTIFHVTSQNVLGQALFAFPDITAYLLVVMIILNLLAIRADMQKPGIPTIATANIVLDVFCILAYSWATMQFIAELLNRSGSTPGGILNYSPTLGFAGYHVTSGHLESMGTGFGLDLTLWMLLAIVALNAIKAKSDRRRQTR
jgi:hypothetical protein